MNERKVSYGIRTLDRMGIAPPCLEEPWVLLRDELVGVFVRPKLAQEVSDRVCDVVLAQNHTYLVFVIRVQVHAALLSWSPMFRDTVVSVRLMNDFGDLGIADVDSCKVFRWPQQERYGLLEQVKEAPGKK